MAVPRGQLLVATLLGCLGAGLGLRVECDGGTPTKTVYDFSADSIYENETISLEKYRGSLLAITNVATYWGLTRPHYLGMNAFMAEFSSSHFEVLAFPSNNFHLQEPGDGYAEILNGIKWVRPGGGYVPNFQMFKKIDVNGKNEHPLYTYLKSRCGPTGDTFDTDDGLYYDPIRVSDVRWNFEIFIISRTGVPIYRYSPDAPIDGVAADIRKLINPPQEIEISNEVPDSALPVVEPASIPFQDTEELSAEGRQSIPEDVEPVEIQEPPTGEGVEPYLVPPLNEIVDPVMETEVDETVSEERMQEVEEDTNNIYPEQSPVY